MSNIRSFGDFSEESEASSSFSFAGGNNSAIGIDEGSHVINSYVDGFTVDNGAFRSLDIPENKIFLSLIKSGIAPPEIQSDKEQSVHFIEHPNQRYRPDESGPPETPIKSESTKPVVVNKSFLTGQVNTQLRIRLSNNQQLNLVISEEASIGDLFQVISETSGVPLGNFRVLSSFPPREISTPQSATLKEADLLACNLVQEFFG